ncbi:hypothetical protein BGW80DRAFT_253370 [Lactifluus volemus]|nr:hypothetical protein BGW80DRAFT_253370 [Lactifluus volemus]
MPDRGCSEPSFPSHCPGVSIVYPPAGVIFAAIGFLLSAAKAVGSSHGTSQRTLAELFQRIEKFIRRLESYTKVTPTPELQEVIVNVMTEVLSVLAIATEVIALGKADQRYVRRLDDLTKEEALAAVAQAIHEAHRARDEVSHVAGGVERVEREVEDIENRVEGLEEGQMNDCLGYLDVTFSVDISLDWGKVRI